MIAEPVAQAWEPACMEPDELARWQEMNGRTSVGHAQSPCADCLPAFSAEMRAIGRCNGTPKGGQEVDEMVETLPRQEPNRWPEPRRARALELELVTPPCGSCAHEPVCGLRSALEGLVSINADPPALPDGLSLSLVATVECAHFLRDRAKAAPVRVLTSQERGPANGAALHRTLNLTPEQRALRSERTTAMNLARAAAKEGAAAG